MKSISSTFFKRTTVSVSYLWKFIFQQVSIVPGIGSVYFEELLLVNYLVYLTPTLFWNLREFLFQRVDIHLI